MKENRTSKIAWPINLAAIVIAIAALNFTSAANAQSQATGDDGIAASPKVRQMLNERKVSVTPLVPTMACPKCADVMITELNRNAKGGEVLTGSSNRIVAKHACVACETTFAVVGEGKAKHTVASHQCVADVLNPATCCTRN